MISYEIERPSGPERGIRVVCQDHDEEMEFQPGHQKGAFYCSGCGVEIEIALNDPHDWRDLGEWC